MIIELSDKLIHVSEKKRDCIIKERVEQNQRNKQISREKMTIKQEIDRNNRGQNKKSGVRIDEGKRRNRTEQNKNM